MPAATHNYTIEAGATFRRQISYKDAAGVAIDLTGYTAAMQIRAAITDALPAVDLTDANGGLVLGGALGTVDIYITSIATDALTFTNGVYDLELTDAGGTGDVTRILEGKVTVKPAVTR